MSPRLKDGSAPWRFSFRRVRDHQLHDGSPSTDVPRYDGIGESSAFARCAGETFLARAVES
jgi:hypothetical protein